MNNFKLEEYYNNRYFPLEEELLSAINQYCIEYQVELQEGFWECLQQTIQDRKSDMAVPVNRLCCTIHYTDFLAGSAKVSLYFCDEQGETMTAGEWICPWLMKLWQQFEEKVTDEHFYVRSHLHPSMFRQFYPDTIRQILEVLGEYFKIWMPLRMEDVLKDLRYADEFYVTMGEYSGGQKVIWRLRPVVDLLDYIGQDNLPEDALTYRSFQGKRYRIHTLGNLDLQNSRFEDCLFEPWKFVQTDLRGVLFRNCRFHLTDFTQVNLQGAVFTDCIFDDCRFDRVAGADEQGIYSLFFTDCAFSMVTFMNCDWPGVEAWDCEFRQMRTENCQLDAGLLAEMKSEG